MSRTPPFRTLRRRLLRAALALAFLATVMWASPPAAADEVEPDGVYPSLVVQNRAYRLGHELNVHVGILPMDAFRKGVTLSGGYTYHFTDVVGWEIAQFYWSFGFDTELVGDLEAFDIKPTPFETVEQILTTSVVFKPLYFKGAALNDSMVYGELFFVVGGGYGWFTESGRAAVDVGMGLRLWASELFSFRLDVRYVPFFQAGTEELVDVHHEIWIGLGVSLSLQ